MRELRAAARLQRTPVILAVITGMMTLLVCSIGGVAAMNAEPARVGTWLYHTFFSLTFAVVTWMGPAVATDHDRRGAQRSHLGSARAHRARTRQHRARKVPGVAHLRVALPRDAGAGRRPAVSLRRRHGLRDRARFRAARRLRRAFGRVRPRHELEVGEPGRSHPRDPVGLGVLFDLRVRRPRLRPLVRRERPLARGRRRRPRVASDRLRARRFRLRIRRAARAPAVRAHRRAGMALLRDHHRQHGSAERRPLDAATLLDLGFDPGPRADGGGLRRRVPRRHMVLVRRSRAVSALRVRGVRLRGRAARSVAPGRGALAARGGVRHPALRWTRRRTRVADAGPADARLFRASSCSRVPSSCRAAETRWPLPRSAATRARSRCS